MGCCWIDCSDLARCLSSKWLLCYSYCSCNYHCYCSLTVCPPHPPISSSTSHFLPPSPVSSSSTLLLLHPLLLWANLLNIFSFCFGPLFHESLHISTNMWNNLLLVASPAETMGLSYYHHWRYKLLYYITVRLGAKWLACFPPVYISAVQRTDTCDRLQDDSKLWNCFSSIVSRLSFSLVWYEEGSVRVKRVTVVGCYHNNAAIIALRLGFHGDECGVVLPLLPFPPHLLSLLPPLLQIYRHKDWIVIPQVLILLWAHLQRVLLTFKKCVLYFKLHLTNNRTHSHSHL